MALVHSNWPINAPVCHTYFVSLTQMVQLSGLTYVYRFEPNYLELQHHNLAGRFHATCCTATYLWPRPSCQRGISQAIWWMFWRHGCSPGEYHITIDPAGALKGPLKKELDSLVQQEILVKVTKPTDWIDSLVCVSKSTWALRLCLDPRVLNQAIKRPHYFTPTLVDILPMSV